MEFTQTEYSNVLKAMPVDGSYVDYEAVAGEIQREPAEVLQMLWNLQRSGKVKLSIECCLTAGTIKRLKGKK